MLSRQTWVTRLLSIKVELVELPCRDLRSFPVATKNSVELPLHVLFEVNAATTEGFPRFQVSLM